MYHVPNNQCTRTKTPLMNCHLAHASFCIFGHHHFPQKRQRSGTQKKSLVFLLFPVLLLLSVYKKCNSSFVRVVIICRTLASYVYSDHDHITCLHVSASILFCTCLWESFSSKKKLVSLLLFRFFFSFWK